MPQFPELAAERDQAERVKRDVPIIVVIGNPPYNAFAGTSPEEEAGLVEPYKAGLRSKWKIKKFNLDDLYVRFFRIAERRIEATGRGLVCFISSYSYLGKPSFVVVRESLLKQFDRVWIDSLNGDLRETGQRTPTGDPDPSVFTTPHGQAGITLGTAIGLFLKRSDPAEATVVTHRDFWGTSKRQELIDSLSVTPFNDQYEVVDPQPWNGFAFQPLKVGSTYLSWPRVRELAELTPLKGLMEARGGALIDINRAALESRMQVYFDASADWLTLQLTAPQLAKDAACHTASVARERALQEEVYDPLRLVRYIVRPFDVRHAYYTNVSTVWNRARPELWAQFSGGNQFLMSRPTGVKDPEGPPVFVTSCLGDYDVQRGHSSYFPIQKHVPGHEVLAVEGANLSAAARAWLAHLGMPDPDADVNVAAAPWHHALAIAYAPRYLNDNAEGIAIDWPRVPLPNERAMLDKSSKLGARVAKLLDSEVDLPGITCGTVAAHLSVLGVVSADDLRVTVGWGRRGAKNRVNAGRGKTRTRDWTEAEREALSRGFAIEGIKAKRGFALLGRAVDVFLNETTFWRGVPEASWEYVIGGYPVIRKWLSYREEAILGRSLETDEAREVTAMVRRIAAVILLSDDLDANYIACRDCAYSWPRPD